MYRYAVHCRFPDRITYGVKKSKHLTNRMHWMTLYEALDLYSSINAPDDVTVTIYRGIQNAK